MRQPDDGRLCVEKLFAERPPVRELTLKLVPGLFIGAAVGDEGFIHLLDLGGQLLDDLGFTFPRQPERRQVSADEGFEITMTHTRGGLLQVRVVRLFERHMC